MNNELRIARRALAASVGLAATFAIASPELLANTLQVSSCADDGTPQTLRTMILSSGPNDTIDLHTQLSCSLITLQNGELRIPNNITLEGPTDRTVTISGGALGRVLNAYGTAPSSGSVTVNNLTISDGDVVPSGGCIVATVSVALQNSNVTGCFTRPTTTAKRYGAAISAPTVTLIGSRITGNKAYMGSKPKYIDYGTVFAGTQFTCTDSTISDNSAEVGGGIAVKGGATIERCTISGNVGILGGGFAEYGTAQTTFKNSTISGNTGSFRAGGLFSKAGVQLFNSTVAFNSSTKSYAGGMGVYGNIVAQSSIIARNTNETGNYADLRTGATLLGGDNLIISTNATPAPGVITVTADPQLAPLGSHGGPTPTHALLATSPAINAGNDIASLATDQRGAGFVRPVGPKADIGAYERQLNDDEIFANGFD